MVSDFLLLRSSKQAGAFVVNLQNLPETERMAPKWSCLCVTEAGTFVVSFLGHQRSSLPLILGHGPPKRNYFYVFLWVFKKFNLIFLSWQRRHF